MEKEPKLLKNQILHQNKSGFNTLHQACYSGHIKVVDYLITFIQNNISNSEQILCHLATQTTLKGYVPSATKRNNDKDNDKINKKLLKLRQSAEKQNPLNLSKHLAPKKPNRSYNRKVSANPITASGNHKKKSRKTRSRKNKPGKTFYFFCNKLMFTTFKLFRY